MKEQLTAIMREFNAECLKWVNDFTTYEKAQHQLHGQGMMAAQLDPENLGYYCELYDELLTQLEAKFLGE